MKQYYMTIDTTTNRTAYWCGDTSKSHFLTTLGVMVLPLGTKKPRNVSRETLKIF